MNVADDLTVLWDGQLVGRVRVTEKAFDPSAWYGTYEKPARWFLRGEFSPTPLFAECRLAFVECTRLEDASDEQGTGTEMAQAEEMMRAAMLALVLGRGVVLWQ